MIVFCLNYEYDTNKEELNCLFMPYTDQKYTDVALNVWYSKLLWMEFDYKPWHKELWRW